MDSIELFDIQPTKNIFLEYTPMLNSDKVPLIIDNGSYQCRVGWNISEKPTLSFRNLIAKPRKDRRKDNEVTVCPPVQIGNDIVNIEAMRFQLKTQFDRNIVTHYYNQEQIFDYIFSRLGMTDTETFSHPVVLTEPLGNLNYSRQLMSELLFECYGIPSVCYCIDSLSSAFHNKIGPHGLIISFGYHTTHVIPLLNGKYVFSKSRRLSVGGYHIITYLYRLMQMKYPIHLNSITISRMEALLQKYCYVAIDYLSEIKKWTEPSYYDANVVKIQLPYSEPAQNSLNNVSTEQSSDKKREFLKRPCEMKAKPRKEKIMKEHDRLFKLQSIKKLYEIGQLEQFHVALKEHNIKNIEELENMIQNIQQGSMQSCISTENEVTAKEHKNSSGQNPPENVSVEDWINDVKIKRSEILERKQTRKTRRQDLAKRRTAAAQERMRIISQLARKENGWDDFGIRDEDWDVYKVISRDNESESEAENEKLIEYEDILRSHDQLFEEPVSYSCGIAENNQLHMGVELIRVTELLFQPSMIGSPEAGLAELIKYVLGLFEKDDQERLCSNVFMTGGCAKFKGLKERISKELLEMRPTESYYKVFLAAIPDIDSWIGAKDFSKSENFELCLTTANDIAENGYEYFKENSISNIYCPTPKVSRCDADN